MVSIKSKIESRRPLGQPGRMTALPGPLTINRPLQPTMDPLISKGLISKAQGLEQVTYDLT